MSFGRERLVLSVIGARVVGPEPISSVWVPLDPGVEALYGLNGAGKTRLLWSLADLLQGRGEGYLVARIRTVAEEERTGRGIDQAFDGTALERADPDWMSMAEGAPWQDPMRPSWHRHVGDTLWAHLHPPETGLSLEDEASLVAQVNEVVRQDLFALMPGPGPSTQWRVTPAAVIDGTTPRLRTDADRLLAGRLAYETAAAEAELARPFEPDSHPDVDRLFRGSAGSFATHGDSLLTTLTPLFDAYRDSFTDDFHRETTLLADSAITPHRIGDSDAFFHLGEVEGPAAQVVRSDGLTAQRANEATCAALGAAASPLTEARADGVAVCPRLLSEAELLSEVASEVYADLLVAAPRLYVDLAEPERWFFGPPAEWKAIDLSGRSIPLDQLSEAQLRWALVAIELAHEATAVPAHDSRSRYLHAWMEDRPLLVALDEPDAALHATAQRHAVAGLRRIVDEWAATVICSTHSREFLNADHVALFHVARDRSGHVVRSQLESVDRDRIDQLGLAPADLFLLHRVILLVEGRHDEVVIEELIGPHLRAAHVLVLPLRGGKNLASVIDAAILAEYSDAPVIAALDNLHAPRIEAFWDDLLLHVDGGQEVFDRIVKDHFTSKRSSEDGFLIEFCRAAADSGTPRRFRLFGFAEPDIPQYLPIDVLVPGASSWAALRRDFQAQKRFTSFKPWLAAKHGTEITDDLLRAGVAAMDYVPQEFTDLLDLCSQIRR